MRILVACELPDFALEELRLLAGELVYHPELSPEKLAASIPGTNVLVVNRLAVTADAIASAPGLQIIVRAGTETGNISVEEASRGGVFVCNSPNKTAVAIAEMFFSFALCLDRGLPGQFAGPKASPSNSPPPKAYGLAGRTLGCLGFGPASREICRRAQAFGMETLVWSADVTPAAARAAGVSVCAWPRELASRSHIVASCDMPGTSDEELITAEVAQALREEALLVHIGDWSTIDETAVADAIRNKRVRFAIDLPTDAGREAPRSRSRLPEMPGVLITHRLAARTQQARDSIAEETVRVVREFLVSGVVQNCVNLLERSPATWQLVLRLKDAVGVMAGIMEAIRADGINAEEIATRVFTGARAASCTIALDERPSADAIAAIRSLPGVLHLELRAVV